jgi:hypothetical protein
VSFPYVIRSILAVVDGWLAITILATILQQHRDGVHDIWQDWRFIALAAWCCVPVAGLHGRWHSPLTWGTWMAVVATVASVIGVIGIRVQQGKR